MSFHNLGHGPFTNPIFTFPFNLRPPRPAPAPPLIIRPFPVTIFPPPPPPPVTLPIPVQTSFAPVWLYSIIAWLGQSYMEPTTTTQTFNTYLLGADVDPYEQLGNSRLFIISLIRGELILQYGAKLDALPQEPYVPTRYANNDAGILQLYQELQSSSIFASLKYCYISCQIGRDLVPDLSIGGVTPGYDPATGLRVIASGSAVSQVVPLDDFLNSQNEQIYNETPDIVPLASALVYDVTTNNTLNATSFVLPIFYTRDQVAPDQFYVNRFKSTAALSGSTFHCGQTVTFAGGAGYVDSDATSLNLVGASGQVIGGVNVTTNDYGTAKVFTISNNSLGQSAQIGVVALNCNTPVRSTAFSNQRIIGFYRKSEWTSCFGVPIYDYGPANANFTPLAIAMGLDDPGLIYDPALPYLNGGSLRDVVKNYVRAQNIIPPDQLLSILRGAIGAHDSSNVAGLGVTTASLHFQMTSAQTTPVLDQLTVPVVATIKNDPPRIFRPPPVFLRNTLPLNRSKTADSGTLTFGPSIPGSLAANLTPINSDANNIPFISPLPVTVQAGLTASVPREALDGTGIMSLDLQTPFPRQSLGSGSAFQALQNGTVINLMAGQDGSFSHPPFDLALPTAGIDFTVGTYYIVSLSGSTLTARSSQVSDTAEIGALNGLSQDLSYVGAMVFASSTTSVRLYPKLQLMLACPAVGTHGVVQGQRYSIRLAFGTSTSLYDIIDVSQKVVERGVNVANPSPIDGSTPHPGDLYFGSFRGGDTNMAVWSIPVFLSISASQLPSETSYYGGMTLTALSSGTSAYQLQITDSSLFVFSNINVDTSAIGSLSLRNIFLAGAVINSAPDDTSSNAFAPSELLLGTVQQVGMGGPVPNYVFIPQRDSVVIGGVRYMVSVIEIGDMIMDMTMDPNKRPYPPVQWHQTQYWQFANRHNPYLDVGYKGDTQAARTSQAEADIARLGLHTAAAKEPIHLYLDTDRSKMTVWPIYRFPFATNTQFVTAGQIRVINNAILEILARVFPPKLAFAPGSLDGEQITLPAALQLDNPFTFDGVASAGHAASSSVLNQSMTNSTSPPPVIGLPVTQLNPAILRSSAFQRSLIQSSSLLSILGRNTASGVAPMSRETSPTPAHSLGSHERDVLQPNLLHPLFQSIFGFSVYNPTTGEAYIVELVNADLDLPDSLSDPTKNVTYDPYYVRVVFLNSLTCYNMSIIVPSMVYDQQSNFARQGVTYQNVHSKTNEIGVGYMGSFYDAANNFDNMTFTPHGDVADTVTAASQTYLFTNIQYSTPQSVSFNPGNLFSGFEGAGVIFDPGRVIFSTPPVPPIYFICRRQNWDTKCHLMQVTHPTNSSVYLSYGAGDMVPFKLDLTMPVPVDRRQPSHMYKFSHKIPDRQYESVKTISVGNVPFVIAVSIQNGVPQFVNFSLDGTSDTTNLKLSSNETLVFPNECYVVGQASTTLTSVTTIGSQLNSLILDTSYFVRRDISGMPISPVFKVIPYNNLVYVVRMVSGVDALGAIGGIGVVSGFLVDTFVPSKSGHLRLAQAARHKRSGLSFFGSTYTPTTMVDTIDSLDFTSITGEIFYSPTVFIPVPDLDDRKGFFADLSNFLDQQIWTFVYSEIVAQPGDRVYGVTYPTGHNLDVDSKPVLTVQKLHFIYDPLVVMYSPNDLSHRYPLQPKQQVLALTNGQIVEGICWRSANLEASQRGSINISAEQIIPTGPDMDRPNKVYSSHNRSISTPTNPDYKGMSVNSIVAVEGVTYSVEESAMEADQAGSRLVSSVSSTSNLLIAVLFEYDNNDLGSMTPATYDSSRSNKGVVLLNGYLSATGYSFSSPDHFDVNDVLPSQVALFEQISSTLGDNWDLSFYNLDITEPRQFWNMKYDTFTAPGLSNYISNVPSPPVDPHFTNRTRSLILSLENSILPDQLGLIDTYSSVVSVNLHMQNGVTGSVFLGKKAERDMVSVGALHGLPPNYDFFIFSRDHYGTLFGATFEIIDQGYAMCLVDDGSGTGKKVAKYFIDSDGNYFELYTYTLATPASGVIESSDFVLKVTLGSPASSTAAPETPNNVNPQDLVKHINRNSQLVYATFGPSAPGQPPAYIPIQSVAGGIEAAPITGAPGFNGYSLSVVSASMQPVQIAQIYSGSQSYSVAGGTSIRPINTSTGQIVPFYGSISHGLDRMVPVKFLPSEDHTAFIPRPANPPGPPSGNFGGNGLGSLSGKVSSCAFQGSAAIPQGPTNAGSIMKGDDGVFYTYNAISNTIMDSAAARVLNPVGGQYFVDATTDSAEPIYGVVTLPTFTLNGNLYTFNLSTTLADGETSRFSLVVGGKSYLFNEGNKNVLVDETMFTFNPLNHGSYTVTYAATESPAGNQAPSNTTITPFSIAAGGKASAIDIFSGSPTALHGIVLGVAGHQYSYDPIHGQVTINHDQTTTIVPILSGLTFTSFTSYGYVIAYKSGASGSNGSYTINGSNMFPYSPSTAGDPASFALMTSPKIFTKANNFYTFDQDTYGFYVSVTGNGQVYPINSYQFSINGVVYIINSNIQPNSITGGGNVYSMNALNTQFRMNETQYTIMYRQSSYSGATVSGQFNITKGNVVTIENYVYQLDTLNGQIVGNGTVYPLTASGLTYTISAADRSFTVTTAPNASTVTIGNIVYQINNTTVVGDGVTYPVLQYRSFLDGPTSFSVELDGTVSVAPPIPLLGFFPYTGATFVDGGVTYTVNNLAASDINSSYFLISGAPSQFSPSPGLTYTLRTDGVSINAGATKTYIINTSGPPTPGRFQLGSLAIFFGRAGDVAAFDGQHYYAITQNGFTDTSDSTTYTFSGNTAVHEGNSYEIFSNLGQDPYFQIPGGKTYSINIPVADTGSATGDIYSVFPISGGQFLIPVQYSIAVVGNNVSVSSATLTATPASTPVAMPSLTAAGGTLTGGSFVDPATKITYTCNNQGGQITFIDSNNSMYEYTQTGAVGILTAMVPVTTGINLALDNHTPPGIFSITNNQLVTDTSTYTLSLSVAYQNVAGPFWPIANGRFTVPKADPLSDLAYTIRGGSVTKGYVISNDDEFSADGSTIYTMNVANVVKTVRGTTLTAAGLIQKLVFNSIIYDLRTGDSLATTNPSGVIYDSGTSRFTVSYNGVPVIYSIGSQTVLDDRQPRNAFVPIIVGTQVTFLDNVSTTSFTFDRSANNQVTVKFPYTNQFFTDVLIDVKFYIDQVGSVFQAESYLSETVDYCFVPSSGKKYMIHYNSVQLGIPVISGSNVNAGVATVGSDSFSVIIDEVNPTDGSPGLLINRNSFEINGNLYTITGTPIGSDYSSCRVFGSGMPAKSFISANTFSLSDANVTYTLLLDQANLPNAITASFNVRPSRSLIIVNDNVYAIQYSSSSTGSLIGQGQSSIPITNSSFTLTNPFDSTRAHFIFSDLNVYNAASVEGQFAVYYSPTFFMASATYTLNTSTQVVTDNDKRPFPLIINPSMFSINGSNYVIDTSQTPHAVIGNNNASPLSTDVTFERGRVIANSTFALNGLVYKYTEDILHNLLTITQVLSYSIAQPTMTLRLDSTLVFTISKSAPSVGNFVGSIVPVGTLSAGPTTLNIYGGTPESGGADFFTYKNVLYTLIQSEGIYTTVQKSYTVFTAQPAGGQQQLAVFDVGGTTCLLTCGSTAGNSAPAGINPGSMWAATSVTQPELQFGLVCGMSPQPLPMTMSTNGGFQFQATDSKGTITLYDIIYTLGSNKNFVKVEVPDLLPTFVQSWGFGFPAPSFPLRFETGGYDAFTTTVSGQFAPSESFPMSYKTPLTSNEPQIDMIMGDQGDFSVEFWHSEPSSRPLVYRPFVYSASSKLPLVYHVDIGFQDFYTGTTESHNVYVRVNEALMTAATAPPMLSSKWRHLAVTFAQPYAIACQGAGFEVKDGSNYNFNREFSIAMTFRVSDVSMKQGLLYKGTGSVAAPPQISMSYMVTVETGNIVLSMTTGEEKPQRFTGPPILAGQVYELIITKQTQTPLGTDDDPYGMPFDATDYKSGIDNGVSLNQTNVGSVESSVLTLSGFQTKVASRSTSFVDNVISQQNQKAFQVVISVRIVNPDGSFQGWNTFRPPQAVVSDDAGLLVKSTGSAHVLIGSSYDSNGLEFPLGNRNSLAIIRQVYLFNTAINSQGIKTGAGVIPISGAGTEDLLRAGVVGHWSAQRDPNGVVNNPFDQTAIAISTNPALALLTPLTGHEYEGMTLYVNGCSMPLQLATPFMISSWMPAFSPGSSMLSFKSGIYRLTEISMWRMCRQPSQILDDMFGRLITTNEPLLILYLDGHYEAAPSSPGSPIVPLNTLIDNVDIKNPIESMNLTFPNVSFGLSGCPAVSRCGPLITPSLYTPPGVALTVCHTIPELTTYSITLNNVSGSMAGVMKEVYVYIQDKAIMLYAGKKVGDLVLSWVSQEEGDAQVIGFVEGAPPCPMANLSNRTNYTGATSVTLNKPTSVSMRYDKTDDKANSQKWTIDGGIGGRFEAHLHLDPFGFGASLKAAEINIFGGLSTSLSLDDGATAQATSSNKVDEVTRYTVKMQGTPMAFTGDTFMANLNTLTVANSAAAGSSKAAILPNPELGGFTSSNPPGQLPRTAPTEEKYGSRMFRPSSYGNAFVSSQTMDVYQQTLLQTNTVYGFISVPNAQIPRDINVISFRMSSKYLRPGCLDGVLTYGYNPATLPSGRQTYSTSTGEMQVLYDKNFAPGTTGHDASYMRLVEAYKLKKEIDQQSLNALAIYHTAYQTQEVPSDSRLIPELDFYNEYVWSSRGGIQETKHTYSTSYNETYSTSSTYSIATGRHFNAKLSCMGVTIASGSIDQTSTIRNTAKYSYNTTGTTSFDVSASFDGIDSDTQMRYSSANDAHFVMKNNSTFNSNNQSGLNLVIGSDGLVYNIVPSVSSGSGVPVSDDIDDSDTYTQPQPSYSSSNANGLTGTPEPYNRPGKVKQFRSYSYFLQPTKQNADDFWNTVVDRVWLFNSPDADAVALRPAEGNSSIPWRLLHRVTYCERFLPPVSTEAVTVPQISPIMAVPVENEAADFLFRISTTSPKSNPHNDVEANVVLVAPTMTGLSAYSNPTAGAGAIVITGQTILPNNVLPFDLATSLTAATSWGDGINQRLLTRLLTSIIGSNTLIMSPTKPAGSTKIMDVTDPTTQHSLYTMYTDPNGTTVNVSADPNITVYLDVNSNPVQYYDGKTFHSLQADYIASPDGTIMYYIQPPSRYDQTAFDLLGDYDLFGKPGDEWRYYLVSGVSANMTSQATVSNIRPFASSSASSKNPYTGFTIAPSHRSSPPPPQPSQKLVQGYVLVQGTLQWPHVNTNAETLADVQVYKAMSLFDQFPLGDLEVLIAFLVAQYPNAPFLAKPTTGVLYSPSAEIPMVFARNITSYFNAAQQALIPQ